MAYTGLPYYGYCTYTEEDAGDGTMRETLGEGKITRSIIKFAPSEDSNAVELWAGDLKEQDEYDALTGSISIDRSYISLQEEAELGGHKWTKDGAEGGMIHKEDDVPPLCRVAAIAKLKKPDRSVAYRVIGYYRAVFAGVADELNTRQSQKNFGTQALSGTVSANSQGQFKYKNEFAKYEEALTDFKKFQNILE